MIRRVAEWCCPRGTIELAFLMDAYRDKLQWGRTVVWEKMMEKKREEGAWVEFEKVRQARQERWMQGLEETRKVMGQDGP